jgi:hypothetical protein
MMELVELWRCLEEAKVEHVAEARQWAILVGEFSDVLVDLGMPPISRIPQNLRVADNILEAAGTISEYLWEAYASDHGPWD